MAWLDRWWDDAAALVRYPSRRGSSTNPYQQPGVALVRETAAYAVALLERDAEGDRARAARALDAVLAHQIDDPASVAHGTWRRSPDEPVPGPAPREWVDYDPNWREFIGCAFALALRHASLLSPARIRAMEAALRRAVHGTLARAVPPEYTNIALLSAFLLDFAGERLGEGDWRRRGEDLSRAVAEGYASAGALPEHNSPTYYGIDLYGLALWRARAPSALLRRRGHELEQLLWRDLARFYHAGLRNLCGPYTRAYGMDMTSYVALLGCWIAAAVGTEAAPLPPLGDAVPHAHDFYELPLIASLGSQPPEDVRPDLLRFDGRRSVRQTISAEPHRVATAQLQETVMWGGEHSAGRSIHWQHHPATLHWRRPDGRVGWLRLATTAPVDAVATPRGLEIEIHTGLRWLAAAEIPIWLELGHPDAAVSAPGATPWRLPGLTLDVVAQPGLDWRWEATGAGGIRAGSVLPAGHAPPHIELRIDVLDSHP